MSIHWEFFNWKYSKIIFKYTDIPKRIPKKADLWIIWEMVLSLFTTKISNNLQMKCSRYQKVYVLKLWKDCFQFRNEIPYNLRKRPQFHISVVRTVFSGIEGIKFFGPKMLKLIPDEMKELESLWKFKRAIKLWKPTSCPCKICKQ